MDSQTVPVPPAAPIKPGPDPSRYPGGYAEQGTDNSDNRKFLWVGFIIYVDYETMVCSIKFETGNSVEHDVPIPAMGGAGPRSWSGSMPERGAKVICGWRKFGDRFEKPHIVAYLSPGTYAARNYEPFSTMDPTEAEAVLEESPELINDPTVFWDVVRLKARKIYPGEFIASSTNGSDLILDTDVILSNRSTNEFRLRDSDQTAVLSVLNEYTSNAAGTYQRGLIKRNAFAFLQDLYQLDGPTSTQPYIINDKAEYNQKIPKESPAYDILRSFGLIDESGAKRFEEEFDSNGNYREWPYVVLPDGIRTSFITADRNGSSFDSTPFGYTEDRKEIRHISKGILSVSEDVDGFTIDTEKELYIEDVHGTVVGNDFTASELKNYRKILSMRVFPDKDSGTLSVSPTLEPINTLDPQRYSAIDDVALARLYRLKSPTTNNEYAFGISKQGKVFLHVPAALRGLPDEIGGSVDANIMGLVKSIIGRDPQTGLSADIRLKGGLNFEIGSSSTGNSATVTYSAPVRNRYLGSNPKTRAPTVYNEVAGDSTTMASGAILSQSNANNTIISGGTATVSGAAVALRAGSSGLRVQSEGDASITVLGATSEIYTKKVSTTYTVGHDKSIPAGADNTSVIAGSISRSVTTGSISDSVGAGNFSASADTGNMSFSVNVGNFSATVGSGSLSLTASGGPASISGTASVSVSSPASVSITAPLISLGAAVSGLAAMGGIPGPGTPHLDYLTGIPIIGNPKITMG